MEEFDKASNDSSVSASRTQLNFAYQSMTGALDTSHVDKRENGFQFNVGALSGFGSLSGLDIRLVQGDELSVKLGKLKDSDKYVILVTTPELPNRMDIDKFFDEDESLMNKVLDAMEQYQEVNSTEYDPSTAEKSEELYKPEKFEEHYDTLVDAINMKKEEYTKAIESLQSSNTVNAFRKASKEDAVAKLKDDYFGKNVKEFTKKIMKYPEADFIQYLNKEMKDKLFKRLEGLYTQKLTEGHLQ